MDLKTLRCFLAVAEFLNFSQAAEAMYMSQPALSTRIRTLEEELGTTLFERNHHDCFLTPQGAAILSSVRSILNQVDDLPNQVSEKTAADAEPLLIGFDAAEDRENLRPMHNVFERFQKRLPDTEIITNIISSDRFEQDLISEKLDVIFANLYRGEQIHEDLLRIPLMEVKVVLVSANPDGETLNQLMKHKTFMLMDGQDYIREREMYVSYIKKIYPWAEPHYCDGTSSLMRNLMYGNAVAILPKGYAFDRGIRMPRMLQEFELPSDELDPVFSMIWNKHNLKSSVGILANEVRREFRNTKK